jgi:hypothetical protein
MINAARLSERFPLDRNVLGTAKGPWLIHVNAVLAAKESENASLQLVLENLSDETYSENRRLYLVVPASRLDVPQERVAITQRIRRWVETTRGNGFLDLVTRREKSVRHEV